MIVSVPDNCLSFYLGVHEVSLFVDVWRRKSPFYAFKCV